MIIEKKKSQLIINACPEHGFECGYILCAYCRDMRAAVVKAMKLEIW